MRQDKENELVIVSVFVNPTQFGPGEDLEAYPRTLEADCILAGKMGADIVFAPAAKEMLLIPVFLHILRQRGIGNQKIIMNV